MTEVTLLEFSSVRASGRRSRPLADTAVGGEQDRALLVAAADYGWKNRCAAMGLAAPNLAEPEVAERNQVSEKQPPWRLGDYSTARASFFTGADPLRQIENTKALPGLLQRL
jgi:hypothetical protein